MLAINIGSTLVSSIDQDRLMLEKKAVLRFHLFTPHVTEKPSFPKNSVLLFEYKSTAWGPMRDELQARRISHTDGQCHLQGY
jgi:hypothetical protein